MGDGRGEINAALYRTEYEDLQISQYDGRVGFNVGNAKATVVQGIELDGRWALTDGLNASYGFAWLDFEYSDFIHSSKIVSTFFGSIFCSRSHFCFSFNALKLVGQRQGKDKMSAYAWSWSF